MATRLKVRRASLIAATESALERAQEQLAQAEQEVKDYDWRADAAKGVATLARIVDNPKKSEKDFSDAAYNVRKTNTRDIDATVRRKKSDVTVLLDFLDMLRMNEEEFISISTTDEQIIWILRDARKNAA